MDVFDKADAVDPDVAKNLGPFSHLAGAWEEDKGLDVSAAKDGQVQTKYREKIVFEPFGPVVNGPQLLYALRYRMTAWPLGQEDPFHEELGYWLWDPKDKQALRSFLVPRGVTVNAGGKVEPDAKQYELVAEAGSQTYGITSNPFLDMAFKTVRYVVKIAINNDGSFSYDEDTQLQIHGQNQLFHHTDQNTLTKIA
ncbi:MAG: heme-binding beta-barrel domain-containing protein [Candidatus Omnitrophota bacterium]|nr:heme-binding beta-barrel domain-containing protein [Candidatus Omnitrophota bacterium]